MNLRIISRVDLLVPLMCCDLSDLKSLIPIHIIHMECTLCSNRPSHCFFPTFGMDNSGKICQLYWKALLWICKIAKFESEIFAALGSYIIAHVRRITFKLGNFTHFKALHNWSMWKNLFYLWSCSGAHQIIYYFPCLSFKSYENRNWVSDKCPLPLLNNDFIIIIIIIIVRQTSIFQVSDFIMENRWVC